MSPREGPLVLAELEGGAARLTLNRPERRNALSLPLLEELLAALGRLRGEPAVRVLLLDAAGPCFSAGMDLKEVRLEEKSEADRFAAALAQVYRGLLAAPFPLVSAVDGPARGGGTGLAAAADLVWAGPRASFALPETRLGIVPALVSTVLRRRLSPLALRGLAVCGLEAGPAEALRLGLADRLAASSAGGEAAAFCRDLAVGGSGKAMRHTKAFLARLDLAGLDGELEAARGEFLRSVRSEAARRGLEAFRRRESPRWEE